MNPEREKEIVNLLSQYDVSGVPILKAKKDLLGKGYTEAEIVYGLYSAPFDGKINKPRAENPLQDFYTQNPDKADRVAKVLLLEFENKENAKTIANAVAGETAPGIQAKSYYKVQTADRLGIPYFTIWFLGIVFLIVAIKLNLSEGTTNLILYIIIVAMSIPAARETFIRYKNFRRLKKEVHSKK